MQSGSGRIGKVLQHVKVILRRKLNVGGIHEGICGNGALLVPTKRFMGQKREVHGDFSDARLQVRESIIFVSGWEAGMTIFKELEIASREHIHGSNVIEEVHVVRVGRSSMSNTTNYNSSWLVALRTHENHIYSLKVHFIVVIHK